MSRYGAYPGNTANSVSTNGDYLLSSEDEAETELPSAPPKVSTTDNDAQASTEATTALSGGTPIIELPPTVNSQVPYALTQYLASDIASPITPWILTSFLEKFCSDQITACFSNEISVRVHESLKQRLYQRVSTSIGLAGYDREEFSGFREDLMMGLSNIIGQELRSLMSEEDTETTTDPSETISDTEGLATPTPQIDSLEKRVIKRSKIRQKSFDNLTLPALGYFQQRNKSDSRSETSDGRRSLNVSGPSRVVPPKRPDLLRSTSVDAFRPSKDGLNGRFRAGDTPRGHDSLGYLDSVSLGSGPFNSRKSPASPTMRTTGNPRIRSLSPVDSEAEFTAPPNPAPQVPWTTSTPVPRHMSYLSALRTMPLTRQNNSSGELSLAPLGTGLPNLQNKPLFGPAKPPGLHNILSAITSRYKSDYAEISQLGKGGFGTVYRVRNYVDGREYAVKKIPIRNSHLSKENKLGEIFKEIQTLARLEHVNVVRYHSAWVEGARGGLLEAQSTYVVDPQVNVPVGRAVYSNFPRLPSIANLKDQKEVEIAFQISKEEPDYPSIQGPADHSQEDSRFGIHFGNSSSSTTPKEPVSPISLLNAKANDNSQEKDKSEETDESCEVNEGEETDRRNPEGEQDASYVVFKKNISKNDDIDNSDVELIPRPPPPFLHRSASLPIAFAAESDSSEEATIPVRERRMSFVAEDDENRPERPLPESHSPLPLIFEDSKESAGESQEQQILQPGKEQTEESSSSPNLYIKSPTKKNEQNVDAKALIKGEDILRKADRREVVTIMIKMSLHPLTLKEFLTPDDGNNLLPAFSIANQTKYDLSKYQKHCYHLCSSLKLFRDILEGTQYLHDNGVVHRDLKPGNIFLNLEGTLDHNQHQEHERALCHGCEGKRRVIPKIGDFGLVADLVDGFAETNGVGDEGRRNGVVGTFFYRPPAPPFKADLRDEVKQAKATELMEADDSGYVICTKTDVYALGIILLELLYKFNTGTERVQVILALRDRQELPSDIEDKIAATIKINDEETSMSSADTAAKVTRCIIGMTMKNRSHRWTLERVRKYLDNLAEKV